MLKAKAAHGAVHVMGLFSEGGAHRMKTISLPCVSHRQKRGANRTCMHSFDGRGYTPTQCQTITENWIPYLPSTQIRAYCFNDWLLFCYGPRQSLEPYMPEAYRLMTEGEAIRVASSAVDGLQQAHAADENDEFVRATRIGETVKVQDGDSIVFMNFRADRAREITRAFRKRFCRL